MNTYLIKSRLLQMIAAADTALQPASLHTSGNWHLQAYQINPPFATVRVQMKVIPMYGFKPPTIAHGECYLYSFSIFVWADTMSASRDIMDNILDYLAIHNRQYDVGIIDIINLTTKEEIPKTGPKRLWRMVLNGSILTEETVD